MQQDSPHEKYRGKEEYSMELAELLVAIASAIFGGLSWYQGREDKRQKKRKNPPSNSSKTDHFV